MADTPEGAPEGGGPRFGFLSRKIGPLPVWAWAGIGFGAYYWYTHWGPGKPAAATGGSKSTFAVVGGPPEVLVTGGGTSGGRPPRTDDDDWRPRPDDDDDRRRGGGGTGPPWHLAGDPSYPAPPPSDHDRRPRPDDDDRRRPPRRPDDDDRRRRPPARPRGVRSAAAGVTSRPGAKEASGLLGLYQPYAGQDTWKTATGWEAAAINYLIGEGVPPDQASTSVWSFLHGEPMSTRMTADVNLAQDAIGAPPGQPPPQVTTTTVPARNSPGRPLAATG